MKKMKEKIFFKPKNNKKQRPRTMLKRRQKIPLKKIIKRQPKLNKLMMELNRKIKIMKKKMQNTFFVNRRIFLNFIEINNRKGMDNLMDRKMGI